CSYVQRPRLVNGCSMSCLCNFFFFSSRRRHTRFSRDWSSDVALPIWRLFALARGHRMKRVLRRLLDAAEFLSDFGIRSLSRYHADHPYTLEIGGATRTVAYEPGVSSTGLFGGNSNWRGPVWFPVNFLIIEALQRFHHYYGDDFLVECPTGSETTLTLWEISQELSRRLTRIFLRGPGGRRPGS